MKAFQRLLMAVPAAAFLGTAVAPISGLANELNLQQVQDYSVAQDTSIRDFSDVYPTDWAYQTLAELVDTYGCIAGYPDGTFRGNNPITRYEMAAILNACFDSLATSISMMEGDDGSSMEAMEAMENLQRLNESLSAELITLKGAVDGLDAKVAELENGGQFFTTTKTSFEIATDFVYTPKRTVPMRDENGQPVMETLMEPVMKIVRNEYGDPVIENGRTVMETVMEIVVDTNGDPVMENGSIVMQPVMQPVMQTVMQPVLDETGNPLMQSVPVLDAAGNPILDAAGNPRMRMEIITETVREEFQRQFLTRPVARIPVLNDDDNPLKRERRDKDGQILRLANGTLIRDTVVSFSRKDSDDSTEKMMSYSDPITGNVVNRWIETTHREFLRDDNGDRIPSGDGTFIVRETVEKVRFENNQPAIVTDGVIMDTVTRVVLDENGEPLMEPVTDENGDYIMYTDVRNAMEPVTEPVYRKDGGLAMASSVEIEFETSFTGTDSLSFKLEGDTIGSVHSYLAGDLYDVAGDGANVKFTGFSYETKLGNHMSLGFGTDYDELAGIVGANTYYPGGGTPYLEDAGMTAYGDLGISVAFDLISGDAGTLTASAGYAVTSGDAASPAEQAGLFGDKTDRAGALALNWEGPLFGGNDARFTVVYQNFKMADNMEGANEYFTENWNLILGSYLTETLSLSGNYQFGNYSAPAWSTDTAQWMIAANLEDAFIPGNSFGIAYGTMGQRSTTIGEFPKVLEVYYNFAINDNLEVPIYLDFLSEPGEDSEFAFAVRPTLTF